MWSGSFDDWPDFRFTRRSFPHPPSGHLLSRGEGGEAAIHKVSLRIGLLSGLGALNRSSGRSNVRVERLRRFYLKM